MTMLIVNVLGSKNAVNVPDRGQCEDLNKHYKVAEWFFHTIFIFLFFRIFYDLKTYCQ